MIDFVDSVDGTSVPAQRSSDWIRAGIQMCEARC